MKDNTLKRMYEIYVSNKMRRDHEDIQPENITGRIKKKNGKRENNNGR